MANNEENLIPIKDSDVARALQAKSVESRNKNFKRKKLLKDCIELLLEQDMKAKDGKTVSGAEALSIKMFEKALKGDVKAFEVLRDTAGQKPVEKVMVAEVEQSTLDEIEDLVAESKKGK